MSYSLYSRDILREEEERWFPSRLIRALVDKGITAEDVANVIEAMVQGEQVRRQVAENNRIVEQQAAKSAWRCACPPVIGPDDDGTGWCDMCHQRIKVTAIKN
jgi:hypothetical protein